jgi:hypothetical protein
MIDPDRDDLPPPLRGCLYCHAEGSISRAEGRKLLGLGSDFPLLVCTECGSVASFDEGKDTGRWRIRYRKYNRERKFYFSVLYLGKAGWLGADEALDISTRSFVQRHRVRQAQQGDVAWLHPTPLSPPPPLMNPHEEVYMSFQYVIYCQASQVGRLAHRAVANSLDAGSFFVTGSKIHLLGHRRDWSYHLTDIQGIDYNDKSWFIYLNNINNVGGVEYFQGDNHPDELDAQLVAAVLQALRGKHQPSRP